MNKITVVGMVALAGCATTRQVEVLSARLEAETSQRAEVERRLARIEGDLYKVEAKAAPKREPARPRFVPAQAVAQNVVNAKIKAFVKEYVGVEFGDRAEKFPEVYNGQQNMKMCKKFQYFDNALLRFTENRLTSVELYCYIDSKYSYDSSKERLDQTVADLLVTWGLSSDFFDDYSEKIARGKTDEEREVIEARLRHEVRPTMELERCGFSPVRGVLGRRQRQDGRRFSVSIYDGELAKSIRANAEAERSSAGEALPPAE